MLFRSESHKQRGGVRFVDITQHLQKAARMLRLLTRVEPTDHHNIIPANHLLCLHKPQQHVTNWADHFYQKLDKVCAQNNNTIQHPMLLMLLICHLAAWKLDKTTFGFTDRGAPGVSTTTRAKESEDSGSDLQDHKEPETRTARGATEEGRRGGS